MYFLIYIEFDFEDYLQNRVVLIRGLQKMKLILYGLNKSKLMKGLYI